MADGTAAQPKPSSSVKLVLLGEAAVGKVRSPLFCSCASTCSSYQMLTDRALPVLPGPPFRQQ